MDIGPSNEYDVVELLTRLKGAVGAYPPELLTSRRQKYVRRVTEIGVGLGVAPALRRTLKHGKSESSSTTTTLIETVLIVAIVAEGSVAAYLYRDEISRIVQANSVEVQIDVSASAHGFVSPIPDIAATNSPISSITTTVTTISTPTMTAIVEETAGKDSSNVTPNPNGNNGNHYGQTPKPERTKDKGGNNDVEDKDKDNDNRPTP